jgi:hypothetical protein
LGQLEFEHMTLQTSANAFVHLKVFVGSPATASKLAQVLLAAKP